MKSLTLIILLNAGSLMFWFGCIHLIIGNVIIALLEWGFVQKVFRLSLKIWPLILANYVSMFFGLFVIATLLVPVVSNDNFWSGSTYKGYYDFTGLFIGMGIGYIFTLVIEYPFYYLAQKTRDKNNKILKVAIITNTVSYFIIAIIYFLLNLPF